MLEQVFAGVRQDEQAIPLQYRKLQDDVTKDRATKRRKQDASASHRQTEMVAEVEYH